MSAPIRFVQNDGGRAAAGFKGSADDCVCRAIAIATGKPYAEVYAELNVIGSKERRSKRRRAKSSARTGIYKQTTRRYMASLGWEWVPTMKIGQGCKVHLHVDELPAGRIIVNLSRHVAAVVDGALHDTHDSSRDGTRCVYGYWRQP